MANVIPDEVMTNSALIKDLADVAKDVALLQGILVRIKESPSSSELVGYAPFSLFPTPIPQSMFLQALAVQTHYNTLVDRISRDEDFLLEALASTIAVDDFTARLFRMHQLILKEGISQPITLGLNRSDYMFAQAEDGAPSLKQIEFNTIAAGLGGLSSRIPDVHRLVLKAAGRAEESRRIQDNNPTAGLAGGIATAWQLYGSDRAVVMFMVEEKERNIFDQRCIEYELWKRNIHTIRRRLDDVYETGSLDGDKRLFVDGREVAVVYFRSGYSPLSYTSEQTWDARLTIERSLAIKCPDIRNHLAGTKKVQQELARPGVLERFFPDQPEVAEQIRATFAGLYTLDLGPEGDKTVAMALSTPDRFVLKPQREGGGNNIYGSEISELLGGLKQSSERTAYILMDRIQPAPQRNYLLTRDAPLKISDCVSELGIFGVYVKKGESMVMNECVGYLLRTKSSEHNEGGFIAALSVLDHPLLV